MKRTLPPGFTVLELLIVVAIVGVLTAVALPAIGRFREGGLRVKCTQNLRSISTLVQYYAADHDGRFPVSRLQYTMDSKGNKKTVSFLPDLLNRLYLGGGDVNQLVEIWWCPADRERPENMRKHSYGHNQRLGGDQATPVTWDLQPNPAYDARYARARSVECPPSELVFLIEYVDTGDVKWSSVVGGSRWPMAKGSDRNEPGPARVDYSRHPGIANALMVDGSVRAFTIDDLLHTGSRYFLPVAATP